MTKRRRMLMVSASAKSRLPTGFREVQWLQGSGKQYCVTDIYPKYDASNFTAIRGDFTALDSQNSKFEIGSHWNQSTGSVSVSHNFAVNFGYVQSLPSGTYAPTLLFRYGRDGNNNASVNMSNFVYPLDIHYELNKLSIVHNGGTSTRTAPSTGIYTATKPLVIGGTYNGNDINIYSTQTRYKEFKIYNNNTLLYTFVPCYRKSDNKTGFMKITAADGSTEFFPNMGTDEWIIGSVV